MACKISEELWSDYKSAMSEYAYFTYPENRDDLRRISDREAKNGAKAALQKATEKSKRKSWHQQGCAAVQKRGAGMRRDMDLFRALLLKVEELPANGKWTGIEIEGYTPEQVAYHASLAKDAGFIEAKFLLPEAHVFIVERLTYAGHEFLDAAREDRLWTKAKQTVLSNAGTLTLEALKTALSMLMQQAAHGRIA